VQLCPTLYPDGCGLIVGYGCLVEGHLFGEEGRQTETQRQGSKEYKYGAVAQQRKGPKPYPSVRETRARDQFRCGMALSSCTDSDSSCRCVHAVAQ